jgi:hypothetical protein
MGQSGRVIAQRGHATDMIRKMWAGSYAVAADLVGICLIRTPGNSAVFYRSPLGYLLEGIDWRTPQQTRRPQAAG